MRDCIPRCVFVLALLATHATWSQTPATTNSLDRSASTAAFGVTVDCDFPGGNIVVDRLEGDHIYVHQDLRDTDRDWFYWYFRVKGAAGRTITVHFTDT
ncbi:MAG: hypothetical protein KDA72_10660, partial [Planctomycetales bacterium]|nr:hypothetical protein [Planctomycetales bacterium]